MRHAATLFIAILLSACGEGKPTASDCAKLMDVRGVADRCFGGDLSRSSFIGETRCFPYARPERMKGIWTVALEHSAFVEDAKAYSPTMLENLDTWLEAAPMPKEAEQSTAGDRPRAYSIEIVARRSLCTGHYGHMGVFPHEVIVTRFLSLRSLRTEISRAAVYG